MIMWDKCLEIILTTGELDLYEETIYSVGGARFWSQAAPTLYQ